MITEILENMSQKTQEEILREVTSDHLPQMFEIELQNDTKSTQVKVVTWNILARCKPPIKNNKFETHSNNPWNHEESEQDFNKRLGVQAKKLQEYIKEGVDIFCLQECLGEDAAKIKEKLGSDFDCKTFENLTPDQKGKESYTFYNKRKFEFIKSNNTFFSENKKNPTKGLFLGLAITFKDITSNQNFVVENVHGPFGRADLAKKNSEELKSLYPDIPVISVGDYNIDSSELNEQEGVQTFACNLATNFDAEDPNDRGKEDVIMKTQNKCYDMAHVILPKTFSAVVKATYQNFTEDLTIDSESKIEVITSQYIPQEASKTFEESIFNGFSNTFSGNSSETNFKKLKNSTKSNFFEAGEFYEQEGHYNFFEKENAILKKVPLAIPGSTDRGIFWQIGGGGMNRVLERYLQSKEGNALENANEKLLHQMPENEEDAIGKITLVDLKLVEKDAQIQTILYSASPNLSRLDKNKAKKAMVDFGKKFRNQLNEQGIEELCLPLYSGAIYKGKNEPEEVAEWLMEGWFLAETKNSDMKDVKVYLGHKCLVNAVEKKISKPLSISTKSEEKEKSKEKSIVPKKGKKVVTFADKNSEYCSLQKTETSLIETQIKEKIFTSSNNSGENLSAEDVAIRKVAGSDKQSAKKVKAIWSKKESGKESVLEYAAKGVLKKAEEAAAKLNNDPREVVKEKKKSKEAWYKRFTRTDFEQVDLSETFRTVFVHCTFDKDCVLPKDPSSIDPKYFSNCKFSKALMDKPENEALKKALEYAGMQPDGDTFYKIGRYAGINKEGEPNPNFKAIESFKLTSNYINKLNKTK